MDRSGAIAIAHVFQRSDIWSVPVASKVNSPPRESRARYVPAMDRLFPPSSHFLSFPSDWTSINQSINQSISRKLSFWRFRQRKLYVEHYLPWAINTAVGAKFLLGIYFEERWEQPLADFHREANVVPLVSLKT